MKEELKKVRKTLLTELSMPYINQFTCFEDTEIKLEMKFIWGKKTEVESIEFSLENKTSNILYKIYDVIKCPSGNFYRINLVEDTRNPTNSNHIVNQTALGDLDMQENNLVRFLFNCIGTGELGEYERFPCKFSQEKPK
ncbi:MAG TPA: hypothetical protein VFM82_01330, partial [Flavobacteriaceae bacterium]|nr:hypothetical protein [Flavobacteriaceae bacterium]